jgi:hypothetical protein
MEKTEPLPECELQVLEHMRKAQELGVTLKPPVRRGARRLPHSGS